MLQLWHPCGLWQLTTELQRAASPLDQQPGSGLSLRLQCLSQNLGTGEMTPIKIMLLHAAEQNEPRIGKGPSVPAQRDGDIPQRTQTDPLACLRLLPQVPVLGLKNPLRLLLGDMRDEK